MRRDTWSDLAVFVAIADAGSFTKAGRALGVTSSAISHALSGLEARLGVRLLNRTTRSVAPTEAGEQLLARLRPAMGDVEEVLLALQAARDQPTGHVRLTAHRTAAVHAVLPRLTRLAAAAPDVSVELVIEDGLVDIVAERFDAGVRVDDVLEQDMISVRISEPYQVVVVASPSYLAAAGRLEVPADLMRHRCLNYRYTSSGQVHRWRFQGDEEALAIDPPAVLVSNDVDVLVAAAVAGLGIACASEPQVAEHVAAGRLVRLLEKWCPLVPANHLYYPGRRHVGPALRAVIAALRV